MTFRFPDEVFGWLTPAEAAALHGWAGGRTVLEVGSFAGKSACVMVQGCKALTCVDPWHHPRQASDPRAMVAEFLYHVGRYDPGGKVRAVQLTFAEAESFLAGQGPFDMAYVDAAHDHANCLADIDRARRLIGAGGVIAVHDYGAAGWPDVRAACDGYFGRPPDELHDTLAVYTAPRAAPGRALAVITPCTRVQNLKAIRVGIEGVQAAGWDVQWIVAVDKAAREAHATSPEPLGGTVIYPDAPAPHGNGNRNAGLDQVTGRGWVYFLDDDNVIHPALGRVLWQACLDHPGLNALVVPQLTRTHALRRDARAGSAGIDTAQFVLTRDLIGGTRWGAGYDADRWFYEEATAKPGAVVRAAAEPAAYYNALRVS